MSSAGSSNSFPWQQMLMQYAMSMAAPPNPQTGMPFSPTMGGGQMPWGNILNYNNIFGDQSGQKSQQSQSQSQDPMAMMATLLPLLMQSGG